MTTVNDYLRTTKEIYIPHVAEKFGLSEVEVVKKHIDIYPNARFVDNIFVGGYRDEYWYYEVCDTPYGRGQYHPAESIQKYWLNNQRNDQHVSAFKHDAKWVENLKSTGSVSCQNTKITADLLWIEIDRKDWKGQSNFHESIIDAQKIKQRIRTAYREAGGDTDHVAWVFTSGNSSCHVAVNASIIGSPVTEQRFSHVWRNVAHKMAGDVRFDNGILDVRKESFDKVRTAFQLEYGDVIADRHNILQATENIDPNIYKVNSLIRQPWSVHPKGGHSKILVDNDGKFDYTPRELEIPAKKPLLASWWTDCFEYKKQYERNESQDASYDSTYIIEKLSEHIEGFDPQSAGSDGWVKGCYSPFYNDTNPSVAVNIETGHMYDFGDPTYNLSFEELLLKFRKRK